MESRRRAELLATLSPEGRATYAVLKAQLARDLDRCFARLEKDVEAAFGDLRPNCSRIPGRDDAERAKEIVAATATAPALSTSLEDAHDAVDNGVAAVAVSAPTPCSTECPSHDAAVPMSMIISSATPNSPTTTCGIVPELATSVVSDKALDVDVAGNTSPTTACLLANLDDCADNEDSVYMSLTPSISTVASEACSVNPVLGPGVSAFSLIPAAALVDNVDVTKLNEIRLPPWPPPGYVITCKDMIEALQLDVSILECEQLMLCTAKNPWPPPFPSESIVELIRSRFEIMLCCYSSQGAELLVFCFTSCGISNLHSTMDIVHISGDWHFLRTEKIEWNATPTVIIFTLGVQCVQLQPTVFKWSEFSCHDAHYLIASIHKDIATPGRDNGSSGATAEASFVTGTSVMPLTLAVLGVGDGNIDNKHKAIASRAAPLFKLLHGARNLGMYLHPKFRLPLFVHAPWDPGEQAKETTNHILIRDSMLLVSWLCLPADRVQFSGGCPYLHFVPGDSKNCHEFLALIERLHELSELNCCCEHRKSWQMQFFIPGGRIASSIYALLIYVKAQDIDTALAGLLDTEFVSKVTSQNGSSNYLMPLIVKAGDELDMRPELSMQTDIFASNCFSIVLHNMSTCSLQIIQCLWFLASCIQPGTPLFSRTDNFLFESYIVINHGFLLFTWRLTVMKYLIGILIHLSRGVNRESSHYFSRLQDLLIALIYLQSWPVSELEITWALELECFVLNGGLNQYFPYCSICKRGLAESYGDELWCGCASIEHSLDSEGLGKCVSFLQPKSPWSCLVSTISARFARSYELIRVHTDNEGNALFRVNESLDQWWVSSCDSKLHDVFTISAHFLSKALQLSWDHGDCSSFAWRQRNHECVDDARSNPGIVTSQVPWDPGACSSSDQRQGNPEGLNDACSSTPNAPSQMPWDPGGLSQDRLGGKPNFKKGGLSAILLVRQGLGWNLGWHCWTWA